MKNIANQNQPIFLIPTDNLPGSYASRLAAKQENNDALKLAKSINRQVVKHAVRIEKKERLYNVKEAIQYLGIKQAIFNKHKKLNHVAWQKKERKIHFTESALNTFADTYGPEYLLS